MRGVIDRGTGSALRNEFGVRGDLAGKTGTTQNNSDGWFIAMNPDLVAGAWVGFNDQRVTIRSNYWGQGAHNALRIVGDFMRQGQRSKLLALERSFPVVRAARARAASRTRSRGGDRPGAPPVGHRAEPGQCAIAARSCAAGGAGAADVEHRSLAPRRPALSRTRRRSGGATDPSGSSLSFSPVILLKTGRCGAWSTRSATK